jgi:cation transport regulator ChaC
VCRGAAFPFGDSERDIVLAALRQREGVTIRLVDGRPVRAYVFTGTNVLPDDVNLGELVKMVLKAKGKSGANRDYLQKTFEELSGGGISNPAVMELWEAVAQSGDAAAALG